MGPEGDKAVGMRKGGHTYVQRDSPQFYRISLPSGQQPKNYFAASPGFSVLCVSLDLTLYFYSFCLVSVLGNDSSKGKEFFWFDSMVFALSYLNRTCTAC